MKSTAEQLNDDHSIANMSPAELEKLFGVRDIFVYELDFASLTFGNSGQSSFTIQADSNFLWQQAAFFADLALAAQTDSSRVIPLVTCTIVDQGSGRQLMSSGTPLASIFGTGEMPFTLPTPRFFRAQTQVGVTLQNFSAATNYGIRLSFIGTKFWRYAQDQ